MQNFFGHSKNGDGAGIPETLRVHLLSVADRCAEYAEAFGCREQGYATGLLHDLGKYSEQFQRRLAAPQDEAGRDHWSIGAMIAAGCLQDLGSIPALAIAGHHAGLSLQMPWRELANLVGRRLREIPARFTETDAQSIQQRFYDDGFTWPQLKTGLKLDTLAASSMLDVRMLYSALVDADFIETEAHFAGNGELLRRYRPEGPSLDLDRSIQALDETIASIRRESRPNPMNTIRERVLSTCIQTATACERGLFTLSAPTGSAKTLAMLAFALHHARRHGLRRIILVMPFLNIIEQTARIYRQIFSEERGFPANTVIEHHSLAHESTTGNSHEEDDGVRNSPRLLAENWDAPIVLTTSVQCLESLMSNRPSACRKLHRLAGSIVLFDEVQTLPPKLGKATLATLSRLADPQGPFRSSVVFATATQPAFEILHDEVAKLTAQGWTPRELVPCPSSLFAEAGNRVRVQWRHSAPIDLDDLAIELAGPAQVLCIVNLKRHAIRLASRLAELGVHGVFHLSTNMCPAHRTAVLRRVVRRLEDGRPVRLIATQCVEAGVDLDFPLVYRAIAPLEAIAQAAGRCNRHGLRGAESMIVFRPQMDEDGSRSEFPPGYQAGVDATLSLLASIEAAASTSEPHAPPSGSPPSEPHALASGSPPSEPYALASGRLAPESASSRREPCTPVPTTPLKRPAPNAPDVSDTQDRGHESCARAHSVSRALQNGSDHGSLLDQHEIINSPERIREYYRLLYGLAGRDGGRQRDESELLAAVDAGDFETVSKLYRLIKTDAITVLVPYKAKLFRRFCDELDDIRPGRLRPLRDWMRRAMHHAVNLYRPDPESSLWNHLHPLPIESQSSADHDSATWFIAGDAIQYDPLLGFREPDFEDSWIA